MTREEAITRLKNMAWLYGSTEREQNIEAIDMAISALSVDSSCNNCKEYGSYKCTRCDGEIYYKADSDLISKKVVQDALIEKISRLNAEGEKSIKTATEFCRFKRYIDGMTPVVASEPSKVDFRTDKSENIGTEVHDLISRADAIEVVDRIKSTDNWQGAVIALLSALPSTDGDK